MQRLFEHRRVDFDVADLRRRPGIRARGRMLNSIVCRSRGLTDPGEADLRRRAGGEPVGGRRAQLHALGERHGGVAQVRLGARVRRRGSARCGTFRSTCRPVGVLARVLVGSTLICGVNGSAGNLRASRCRFERVDAGRNGSAEPGTHDCARTARLQRSAARGRQRQERRRLAAFFERFAFFAEVVAASPRVRHCEPRELSWRWSPGMPQIVTLLVSSATGCEALLTLTTTW